MKINLSIVIVLYKEQPPKYVGSGIEDNIILVDNTPERDLQINLPNVKYIPLKKNYGIAKALNVGFQYAQELHSDWVLTMDQDSDLPENMLDVYKKYIPVLPKAAILSPLINMYDGEGHQPTDTYFEIPEALTSGSLINIDAYKASNGFREELFIDGVDFEFCKHVRLLGWHVYQINSVVMQHHLGNTKEIKLFGKHLFYVTNHNYIRHYYMQRNGLYVNQLYRGALPEIPRCLFPSYKPFFKILFFEKDKLRKFRARFKGFCDFKKNVFGEFKGL